MTMDVNGHADLNEAPILENRRQSYGLVSEDLVASSTGEDSLSSRVNSLCDGEYWPTGNDAWNVLSAEMPQAPRVERSYRAKRRNYCETTPYNSNTEEREGYGLKRAGVTSEAKDLQHGLDGYNEQTRTSETFYAHTTFEFFENSAVTTSSSSSCLQRSEVRNAVGEENFYSGSERMAYTTCLLDGPSPNGKSGQEVNLTGQSTGSCSKEKGNLMNHGSTEMVQTPLNRLVGGCPASFGFESNFARQAVEIGACLESTYPLPEVEGGRTGPCLDYGAFDAVERSVNSPPGYMHSGRSRPSKRRMFIPDLGTDSSVLQASQTSSRTGFAGNNDSFVVNNDVSAGSFPNGHGLRETGERTYESPVFTTPRDQSHISRSHFARNMRRTARSNHVQNLFPRTGFPEPQQLGNADANIPHEACWNNFNSASVSFWDRSINSWSNEDGLRRGRNLLSNRSAPLRNIEGNFARGVPGRAPSWPRGPTNESTNASSSASSLAASMLNSGAVYRNISPPPASINSSVTESSPAVEVHGEGLYSSASRLPLFLERRRHEGSTGSPFHRTSSRALRMVPADGERRNRFLSEILSSLEHAWRSEELSYEELVMLDPSLLFGGVEAHDRHSDLRLDVDNMSYEELLALEERIGNVSTGLSDESISLCVSKGKFSSLDATVAAITQESDNKCSICQEEFVEEDRLGRLECGHGYHMTCIKTWLLLKNLCPICKAPAYSKS